MPLRARVVKQHLERMRGPGAIPAGCQAGSRAAFRAFRYCRHMEGDDEFAVSYQGVTPGVPVLTAGGKQFGVLEHVLEVPEEDVFDGIVVWTGGGGWLDRRIQRDLSRGAESAAQRLELLQPQHLRFVDADRIEAITVAYIRCALDEAQATALRPPARDAPVFYANAIDEAPGYPLGGNPGYGNHAMYGSLFGRERWRRES